MDFPDALRAVMDGKAVRRRVWRQISQVTPEEFTLMRLETPGDGWDPVFIAVKADGSKTTYNASHGQMLADDWEIA